jgi:acyl CoA:acetate/3-ketoacid CoA transferase beta subunit
LFRSNFVISRSTPTRRVTPRFWLVRFCFSSTCYRTTKLTLLPDCTFPLTGPRGVSTIITDLAVFDVSTTEGLTLIEHAEGVTVEEIRSKTAAPFKVSEDLKPMQL